MSRIGIFTHSPSQTVIGLSRSLVDAGLNSRRLLSNGDSLFRGRSDDFVINYGSVNTERVDSVVGEGRAFNHPRAVNLASDKLVCLGTLSQAGVAVVPYTTDRHIATVWAEDGGTVFCRNSLRGHSGEGIVVCSNSTPSDLGSNTYWADTANMPNSPLYTKGIDDSHRELRVHVAFGRIILSQQKRRRDGYRDLDTYSMVVRNYNNGWIYATSDVNLTPRAERAALDAVSALSLDFGAVDIITRGEEAWVLEVNTAPGMQGQSTLDAYVNAFTREIAGDGDASSRVYLNLNTDQSEPVPDSEQGAVISEDSARSLLDTLSDESVWSDSVPSGSLRSALRSAPSPTFTTNPFQTLHRRITGEDADMPLDVDSGIEYDLDLDIAQIEASLRDVTSRRRSATRSNQQRNEAMDSQGEVPTPENLVPWSGPGHYVVSMPNGSRTVAHMGDDGVIYSSEYDIVLQANAVSVISQVSMGQ